MRESVNSLKTRGSALTSREVADALGVSESSVKRWCDSGRLRTVRTPGGHRRIPVESVLELSRRGGPPVEQPDLLAAKDDLPVVTSAVARRHLLRALVGDDATEARRILEAQRRAATGFDVVADEVIAPAMALVGERWAKGTLDIYEERRACGLLHGCLHAIADKLPAPDPGAPSAIGGTLEGDPFTLPTALAELVLRERGFAARSLGAWLPAATIARAIAAHRPRLVWLAVGHVEPGFANAYATVERAARAAGAALVVGGRALDSGARRGLRYAAFCDGMVHLASFADALR